MGTEFLLPPSANWFNDNALSIRESDKLVVFASFKNILVYNLIKEPHCASLKALTVSYGMVN